MARKRKDPRRPVTPHDFDHPIRLEASSAETAEYIVQMCTELRMLAKSYSGYVASMTCELATLASSAKLERLTLLLDKVRKEAETVT